VYMGIKKQRGFTLIEVLVVISITGLLASIVLVALKDARGKSRDTKRKSDLHQMQTALELYYNEHNEYPNWTVSGNPQFFVNFSLWRYDDTTPLKWCLNIVYPCLVYDYLVTEAKIITKLPLDPTNKEGGNPNYLADGPAYDLGYVYYTNTNGQGYILGTNLEEEKRLPSVIYPDLPEFGNYQLRVGY